VKLQKVPFVQGLGTNYTRQHYEKYWSLGEVGQLLKNIFMTK
jgi:hypothetical protein